MASSGEDPERGIRQARPRTDLDPVRLGAPIAALVATAFLLAAPASSAPERLARNGLLAYASEFHAAELYLANADGSGLRRLTDEEAPSRWPVLSPDGSKVAFGSNREGSWNVYVMNIDGTGLTNVSGDAQLPWGFDGYPDWSPDGTKLAFTANTTVDGSLDVVVYDLPTGALKDVTGGPADDLRPRWSPGGTRLAYGQADSSGIHVCVVNADGTGLTQLTHAAGWQFEPTWSPDGTQIAYTTWPNQTADIFVMNADGSGAHDVTNTPRAQDTQASWSSAGIAFRSNRDGLDGVYVMQPDGSQVRRFSAKTEFEGDPSWSRDGGQLVFMSGRDARSAIVVSAPDESQYRQLTNGPWFDNSPSWSPDGRRLAFERSTSRTVSDIYVMNAKGGAARNLTRGRGLSWAPAWSPDGKRIAYVHFEGFGGQVWVMNADWSKKRPVTSGGAWNDHPTWSPDGTRIAYSGRRGGEDDLFVLDLRTHRERRVARDAESPAWSPDGSRIAFAGYGPDSVASDVCVVRPDGTGWKQLTHAISDNGAPAWSPDAREIVYEKDYSLGHDTDLYVVSASGGPEHLAIGFNWPQNAPSWQPVR